MTLILNILWFVLGGFITGLSWLVAALLLAVTVVGLPWAIAAARIGLFAFFPFGKKVVVRREMTGQNDLGTGPVGRIMNMIWFVLGGWHVALAHLVIGVALLFGVISIPFSIQHFKLARIALAPIGKIVVDV
jgi:uncharacterized membrane protein YccF (DUF307 family)